MASTSINSIRDFAAAARGRRLALGLSQEEVAARASVSRQWISAFEAGKPSAELGLVIRLLDSLALRLVVDEDHRAEADQPAPGATDLDALLEEHRRQ